MGRKTQFKTEKPPGGAARFLLEKTLACHFLQQLRIHVEVGMHVLDIIVVF